MSRAHSFVIVAAIAAGIQACSSSGAGAAGAGGAASSATAAQGATNDASAASTGATSAAESTSTSTSGAGGGGSASFAPKPGTTWQIQLQGTIDTSVDAEVFDVDLFDTPDEVLATLHGQGAAVICYFSAGSREDWRDDAGDFAPSDYGNELDGWPGESWLDVRSANVRAIMKTRLDTAKARGCDGVDPDNVDGYANDSGFPLTAADQVDYDLFLADEAHARGMSVGLKNGVDLVGQLVASFDWELNEECQTYSECDTVTPFLQADKAVFHIEYADTEGDAPSVAAAKCGDAAIAGFSTLIKTLDLDAFRLPCP